MSDGATGRTGDGAKIGSCRELKVYCNAMDAAMRIFEVTRAFPAEGKYSMTDQVRRSSRSVCATIAEAWRKRRYRAHFISKLCDASSEAEETRVWLEFARRCGYVEQTCFDELDDQYDKIISQLTLIFSNPDKWTIDARRPVAPSPRRPVAP